MIGPFLGIFLGTFILEDLALAGSIVMVDDGQISPNMAMIANILGIGAGDAILYGLGLWVRDIAKSKESWFSKNVRALVASRPNTTTMLTSIIASRFLPGVRLPTRLAAGFYGYSFFLFLLFTILSVSAWVLLIFKGGFSVISLFNKNPFLSVLLFLFILKMFSWVSQIVSNKWILRYQRYSLMKWRYFEFWPAVFFYLPIIPYYIFLSLKYRSFLIPFYARAESKNGGLVGESKWDFLQSLQSSHFATLPTLFVRAGTSLDHVFEQMTLQGITFPCVLKPDVGQRGFGVRIVESELALKAYLEEADFNLIVQKRSEYLREAGIFYVRCVDEKDGWIFSITDKTFPTVTGDGVKKLGDLILSDSRSRLIAPTYFKRFQGRLDWIPTTGAVVPLVNCGNHAQGAIFHNGKHLNSENLRVEIERISKTIPNFYFGRFDVRYKSADELKEGREFHIVEINGAGSEATHIWDRTTKLLEAYGVLFEQWALLFKIGYRQKLIYGSKAKPNVSAFLVDWIKLAFRGKKWTTSS